MMPGMIMLWYGPVADIPSGWHLCDGTVNTPDLRDKFVIGAKEDVGGVAKAQIKGVLSQSGGDQTHTHVFTGDGHSHDLASGDEIEYNPPAGNADHHTGISPATGQTNWQYHFPVCYALCYIMKLPIP